MTDDTHPKIYLYRRIVAAKRYIDEHYTERIQVQDMAKEACFSKYHFLRLFKQTYGQTPHAYLTSLRIKRAKVLLLEESSITQVCFALGFESLPSFTHLFKRHTGLTPQQYLEQSKQNQQARRNQPKSFVPNCFAHRFSWEK